MNGENRRYSSIMQKIYWINLSIFTLLLTLKFFLIGSVFGREYGLINMILVINSVVFSIVHLLALFEPHQEKPNWAIVYPELRKNKN